MNILVTGAGGFLGRALTPLLVGDTVYALYHKPPKQHIPHRLLVLVGDILKPDLGIANCPPDIDAIYHLAARLDLTNNKKVWEPNVVGTRNVLSFMKRYNIPRLVFISTAYTQHTNAYGISKQTCERDIVASGIKYTIFKPSIIVPPGKEFAGTGAFYQAIRLIAQIHRRVEPIREKIEGILKLPPLRAEFRILGDKDAILDMVPVNWVADSIASIQDEGTYWLTNPNSVKLQELCDWIGEVLWLDIKVMPEFKPSIPEAIFQKAGKSFLPYLWKSEAFTPTVKDCPPINKEFIQETIVHSLLTLKSAWVD